MGRIRPGSGGMVMGFINRFAINRIINGTLPRPRPFSLWSQAPDIVSDYTSWPSLVDRSFSDRHLPPADPSDVAALPVDAPYEPGPPPRAGDVTGLFARTHQIDSPRSTVLFALFAQWFTDSILRIHPTDRRKNTSNHDVDLCQIYGLTEATAEILRSKQLGKLKSQVIDGEEFPPHLYGGNGQPKSEFANLSYVASGLLDQVIWTQFEEERKASYYATGLERGNSTVGYTAVSTLFLREHNRVCDELHQRHPQWDDERLFQTTRNILIVLLMKLVVEEYINHIKATRLFRFELELGFAEKQRWYRPNWIALEFDLLYRWHSLMPDTIELGGVAHREHEYRVNNALLEQAGLGAAIDALSRQPAGRVGLGNTPDFLLGADASSIALGRRFRLQSFNQYCRRFEVSPARSFADLTGEESLARRMSDLYGDIERLDLYVGLFAQKLSGRELFGELMTQMVAVDAFSQIFTNPLLSRYVYGEETFSPYGVDLIEQTRSVQDLVERNVASGSSFRASFDL